MYTSASFRTERLAVYLGLDILFLHGDLVKKLARAGIAKRIIYQELQRRGYHGAKTDKLGERAVLCALRGNSDPRKGKLYEGLISKLEYDSITDENRARNFLRSRRNLTEWSADEKRELITLSENDCFKYRGVASPTKIAKRLNRKYHSNKSIRTRKAVHEMLKRMKTQS